MKQRRYVWIGLIGGIVVLALGATWLSGSFAQPAQRGTPVPASQQPTQTVTLSPTLPLSQPTIEAATPTLPPEPTELPLPTQNFYPRRLSYPVKSQADLVEVVYYDEPRLAKAACFGAKAPGEPILLTALDDSPDDYLVPFYENGGLCGLATVQWREDGFGHLGNYWWTNYFPFADLAEANTLMEQFTRQKVVRSRLVQGDFSRFYGPEQPFWELTLANGRVYYIFTHGMLGAFEEGHYENNLFVVPRERRDAFGMDWGRVTPQPPAPPAWPLSPALARYSVSLISEQELPQMIYNYPFDASHPSADCIRARNPGAPIWLGSSAGAYYYQIPFFQDRQLCAIAIASIKNKTGQIEDAQRVGTASFGDAARAAALVEQVSKQKVTASPVFVKTTSPFQPFWKVTTPDGQLYYVVFKMMMYEDGGFARQMMVIPPNSQGWRPTGQ